MTIQDIIKELDSIRIEDSEDYKAFERIEELVEAIRSDTHGHLACEAMIGVLERHSNIEFGAPGEPIHTIESYGHTYLPFLFESLNRKPTCMTVWMLNRVINGEQDANKKHQLVEYSNDSHVIRMQMRLQEKLLWTFICFNQNSSN